MKTTLSLIVSVLLCAGYASGAAENPWAAYRYAPDALREMDLASDKDWTLSVDGGAPRPIKVTAGGWNSDQQEPQIPSADVKDYVIYERTIAIPAQAKGQVVKILFGGCNYGAEVYLDDQKITEHHAPMTPFEADATAVAKPGQTQRLKVKAYARWHYGNPPIVPGGFDYNKGMGGLKHFDGHTNHPYGLVGYVRQAIYPAVHLSAVFVRPSVSGKSLAYDVWIANGSATEREVVLKGALSSWDKRTWSYPALPDRMIHLAPGQVQKVTIEGVPWTLGSESYWRPNIPFREDYQATLHWLNLSLEEQGSVLHQLRQRFGFAEHKEGPFYYTVNGVRYTGFGDCNAYGQIGEYDCWTETACFQPPHGEFKGCPEMWKRYQRIGFNMMRVHQSVPTGYMLDTADEAGFMLVPEGAGRAGDYKFDKANFSFQIQELIRASRNHPSVARYSLSNESVPAHFASSYNPWRWLIDAAVEVDPTRPLVFEVSNGLSGMVPGMEKGHAFQMLHYEQWEQKPLQTDAKIGIRGVGECAWATDGMAAFCGYALAMRLNDWAYFAPWSWLNYWPNFLEGMNTERYPWKFNNYGNRRDGVDGWGSPMVQAVQWVLHPYLVIDRGLRDANELITENSKSGAIKWPYWVPAYSSGSRLERQIEVFNDALAGDTLALNWAAHWDTADGPLAEQGVVGPFKIEPGFHAAQTVAFDTPNPGQPERTLFLVLESEKDGKVVYHDERSRFTVTANPLPQTTAVFVGEDATTKGDWRGKYGKAGFLLAGKKPNFPVESQIDLGEQNISQWVSVKESTEPRALALEDGKRIIGYWRSWQMGNLCLPLNLGETPRQVSLYFLWDGKEKRELAVRLRSARDGRLLDQRAVEGFQEGKYLTWKVQGSVLVEIEPQAPVGKEAVLSGLFVD
ncbi:MAG: sugar-binding domain-containing protein [Verrucomicrobiota bacterium]